MTAVTESAGETLVRGQETLEEMLNIKENLEAENNELRVRLAYWKKRFAKNSQRLNKKLKYLRDVAFMAQEAHRVWQDGDMPNDEYPAMDALWGALEIARANGATKICNDDVLGRDLVHPDETRDFT